MADEPEKVEIPSAADACDAFRYKFVIDHIIKVIPLHSIVLIESYGTENIQLISPEQPPEL